MLDWIHIALLAMLGTALISIRVDRAHRRPH